MNPPQEPDVRYMDSLIAEMVLDKAIRDFHKEKLLKEIDLSLENGNMAEFMRLTEELKMHQE